MWIAGFGVIMNLGSLIQYILINNHLSLKKDPNDSRLDLVPIIYVVLSLGALYLQMNK